MLFDGMMREGYSLHLYVKKTCYSNSVKNITMPTVKIRFEKHALTNQNRCLQHVRSRV